jgi:hypothetical protein
MSTKSNILTAFNDHFIEFIDDIISIFPDDLDILSSKNSMLLVRKSNPRLIVYIWTSYVVDKYKDKIDAGNVDFFINKDYSDDLAYSSNTLKIVEVIDRIRKPVKMMNAEDQAKTVKYVQNLTKLSTMYNEIV